MVYWAAGLSDRKNKTNSKGVILALRPQIKLNGVVLPPPMIATEAQHHPAKTPAAAFQAAARALIIRTLLLEEAGRLGIVAESELIEPGKRETDDEARIRVLVEERVPTNEPDEAQCLAFYEENRSRFRSVDLFEASHILFAAHPHDADAYSACVARAEDVISKLISSPHQFENIAREESECDSRANGGHLGQIVPGETVPEFEAVLYKLEEGEIASEPVRSRFGVHVLRLDARAIGEILPFDYVQERISMFLTEKDWRRDVAQFVDGLVSKAEIEGVEMTTQGAHEAAGV